LGQINRVLSRIKRRRELPGGAFSGFLIEKREDTIEDSLRQSNGIVRANEYNGTDINDNTTGTGSSVVILKVTFSELQQ
jgi:hypothetical protein